MNYPLSVSKLFTFIAVLCFVLATFRVHIGTHDMIAPGLAFGFAAYLIP